MTLLVKICGLSTEETMTAALEAGADLIGFVFHPKSPRYVAPSRAAALAAVSRGRAASVALTVDADDELLAAIADALAPDWLQLHGQEPADRVRALCDRPGAPRLIKAIGVAEAGDLDLARNYAGMADLVLLDAKPPMDAAYPGGHGRSFDWSVLKPLTSFNQAFMLSGGLTPGNVGEAIRQLRRSAVPLFGVDVSSGVESAAGVKDVAKIRDFVAAARVADAEFPDPRPALKP